MCVVVSITTSMSCYVRRFWMQIFLSFIVRLALSTTCVWWCQGSHLQGTYVFTLESGEVYHSIGVREQVLFHMYDQTLFIWSTAWLAEEFEGVMYSLTCTYVHSILPSTAKNYVHVYVWMQLVTDFSPLRMCILRTCIVTACIQPVCTPLCAIVNAQYVVVCLLKVGGWENDFMYVNAITYVCRDMSTILLQVTSTALITLATFSSCVATLRTACHWMVHCLIHG